MPIIVVLQIIGLVLVSISIVATFIWLLNPKVNRRMQQYGKIPLEEGQKNKLKNHAKKTKKHKTKT